MTNRDLIAGIVLTVLAGTLFALMDGFGKHLTTQTSVLMVVWGRYLSQTLLVAGWLAGTQGGGFLRTRRPMLQLLRGAMLLGATMLMYTAIAEVPLADATATLFVSPILVTVFSVLFLGERIGIHRICAVLVGFAGVLLVVRPGAAGVEPMLVLALLAAVANAAYLILTRQLAGEDDAASTRFNTTAVGAVLLSLATPLFWETPSLTVGILMVATGAIGTLGHSLLILAFSKASASLLSPFLYSQVLFAAIVSVLVFADPLESAMIAGTLLLVGSGLYIWWRENREAVKARPQAGKTSLAVNPPSSDK